MSSAQARRVMASRLAPNHHAIVRLQVLPCRRVREQHHPPGWFSASSASAGVAVLHSRPNERGASDRVRASLKCEQRRQGSHSPSPRADHRVRGGTALVRPRRGASSPGRLSAGRPRSGRRTNGIVGPQRPTQACGRTGNSEDARAVERSPLNACAWTAASRSFGEVVRSAPAASEARAGGVILTRPRARA